MRAAVRIGDGMKLGVHPAFGAANQLPEIPIFTRRLAAVRWAFRQVASIMTRLAFDTGGGQSFHHAGEDAHLTPALPAVVERIAPAQSVAIDENDPAQHPPVAHPRLANGFRENTAGDAPSAHPSAGTGRYAQSPCGA